MLSYFISSYLPLAVRTVQHLTLPSSPSKANSITEPSPLIVASITWIAPEYEPGPSHIPLNNTTHELCGPFIACCSGSCCHLSPLHPSFCCAQLSPKKNKFSGTLVLSSKKEKKPWGKLRSIYLVGVKCAGQPGLTTSVNTGKAFFVGAQASHDCGTNV